MEKSPTGTPILPPAAIPYLVGVAGIAATAETVLPPHTVAAHVARFVLLLMSVLGIASPGLRR